MMRTPDEIALEIRARAPLCFDDERAKRIVHEVRAYEREQIAQRIEDRAGSIGERLLSAAYQRCAKIARNPDGVERCRGTEPVTSDDATNPRHYADLRPEPIDVIEGWGLGFALGNVVKYVARERAKGGIADLRKARFYLDREIARREREAATGGER